MRISDWSSDVCSSDLDQVVIDQAAIQTVVVQAANMSLGVNLLQLVTEQVARALDPDYDIEIVEMHHRHKVDAPSGTALMLGEAAAKGRDVALSQVARMARERKSTRLNSSH